MASKRKQDDKHLKLLREMVSREHNKTCFECNQRGPTYVDMTIGTFVCTSCSGILRGLNPPHRVKSISMASYTSAEMDFLEKHGNEVCRHIWLGLCNSSSQRGPESKEDSKVRDYLVQKYEKKRWYVEPGQAAVLAAAKAKEENMEKKNSSSTNSTPEPKPLKSLVGSSAPPLKVSQPPGHSASAHNIGKAPTLAQTATKQKSVDLLADLGPDPFAAQTVHVGGFGQPPFGQQAQTFSQPAQQPHQSAIGQQGGGFADFSQAFGGTAQTSQGFPESTDQPSIASNSTGDLAELFLSSQSNQQNDPFMPAPQAQASQPSQSKAAATANNSFGAFESAFSPQQAVPTSTPAASSGAPSLVTNIQGLSLNTTPVASVATGGQDKYAAFASLSDDSKSTGSSINWSGGGNVPSAIDWGSGSGFGAGGGGGGGSGLDVKNTSGSGIDWGTGMPKSSAYGVPGSGTTTTSSSAAFGSLPFGAAGTSTSSVQQGNPFMAMSSGGATPATSTMVANPFLASGAPATSIGTPSQTNGLFGMQSAVPGMPLPNPVMMGGVGGFNQMPQQPGGGASMQMNGRVGVGFPQGQMAGTGNFGMQPAAMPNQFGMQGQMGLPATAQLQPGSVGGGVSFGGVGMAAMAGLQFNKVGQPTPGISGLGQMGTPQQPVPQGQQFSSWGATPGAMPQQNANPFMGGGLGQTAIPPKSNASNPFL